MGLRGPAPKPAPLRLLHGARPGRDSGGRPVKPPPAFEKAAPDPPSFLSALAREQWELIAPSLERLDLLKAEDQAVFAAFCETWATWVVALGELREQGLTIVNPQSGLTRINPTFSVVKDAQADLLRFAREFGLTPSAEQRLAVTPPDDNPDEDPFA